VANAGLCTKRIEALLLADALTWAVKVNKPRAVELLLKASNKSRDEWNLEILVQATNFDNPAMISARMPLIVLQHGTSRDDALQRNAHIMQLLRDVFPAHGASNDDYPISQVKKA
jgi:predicted component of type VI protein secretion system